MDAELRADQLAARRQRGHARDAGEPLYWKARNLDTFNGNGWTTGGYDRASDDPTLDLPAALDPRFKDRIQVLGVQRKR